MTFRLFGLTSRPGPDAQVVGNRPVWRSVKSEICSKKNEVDKKEAFIDGLALDFAKGRLNDKKAEIFLYPGVEAGLTADEVVRIQMGVEREDLLSDVQRRYKDKLILKLETRAAELKKKSEKCQTFEAGKAAYGKGAYSLSAQLFEAAANEHGEMSIIGGDIRMWLALTYQALGRTEDCSTLFKSLRDHHPSKKTRQQAKDLLFIMEAPRLELGEDERVKIPVMKNMDRASSRMPYSRSRSKPLPKEMKKKKKTFEESFWENYEPQVYVPNRYVLAASIAICICLAIYSAYHQHS